MSTPTIGQLANSLYAPYLLTKITKTLINHSQHRHSRIQQTSFVKFTIHPAHQSITFNYIKQCTYLLKYSQCINSNSTPHHTGHTKPEPQHFPVAALNVGLLSWRNEGRHFQLPVSPFRVCAWRDGWGRERFAKTDIFNCWRRRGLLQLGEGRRGGVSVEWVWFVTLWVITDVWWWLEWVRVTVGVTVRVWLTMTMRMWEWL